MGLIQSIKGILNKAGTAQAPAVNPMMPILRANVRDRWLASNLRYYTPQIVENIARGAMSGNLMAQWLMFDLMEQTWPRLSKNLNELKNAVCGLEWILQPSSIKGKRPTPEAVRRAFIVEQMIWSMEPDPAANENDFEDTQYDSMDGIGKAIGVLEIDWYQKAVITRPNSNATELMWGPRCTRWVHPRYYGFPSQGLDRLMLNAVEVKLNNPEFDLASFVVPPLGGQALNAVPHLDRPLASTSGSRFVDFPKDKFIISIFKQKSGHPVNAAMLRILGFWWAASNFSWQWFLNLAQIFGVPIRWANYANGASEQTVRLLEEMLAKMGSAGYAAFPEGTKLEIKDAISNAQGNPSNAFILAADTVCDVVILGQTLTTTQGDRGSQSLGNVHKDIRDERIGVIAKRVGKTLTQQLIRPICRMNFGDDRECPTLTPAAKEVKDPLIMAQRDQILLSIPGMAMVREEFYHRHEISMPGPGDEIIESNTGKPNNDNGVQSHDLLEASRLGLEAKRLQLEDQRLGRKTMVQGRGPGVQVGTNKQFVDAVARDLGPLIERLGTIYRITDENLFAEKLQELIQDFNKLGADIQADPTAQHLLLQIINTQQQRGLTAN